MNEVRLSIFCCWSLFVLDLPALRHNLDVLKCLPWSKRWLYPALDAHEEKLFSKYGQDVNPVYIQGGSRAVQALIAKDADVAIVSGGVIEATLRGPDLKFIAAHLSDTRILDLSPLRNWADTGLARKSDWRDEAWNS